MLYQYLYKFFLFRISTLSKNMLSFRKRPRTQKTDYSFQDLTFLFSENVRLKFMLYISDSASF